MPQNNYLQHGVKISKSTLSVGDEITLTYNGSLVREGAHSVVAHLGYGDNWEEKLWLPMEKGKDCFKVKIKVAMPGSLNVCFNNNAEVWDNNYGHNYSFQIKNDMAPKEKKPVKTATKVVTKTPTKTPVKKATKTATKSTVLVAKKETTKTSKKASTSK